MDNEKIPNYFSDSNSLIYLVQHCQNDAYLSARLAFHLMVLPLTKQLTCLAGNLWSRTLCGGRSERNEFLLLHEFWKSGFIVPDKVIFGTIKKEPIKKKNVKVNTKKSEPAPEVNTNSVPVIEHELGPVDDDEGISCFVNFLF